MAEQKEAAPAAAAAPAGGSNNKLIMGLLGLNTVVMIGVAAVLFLGQKKQAEVQTLDQVAQGAAQGHGTPPAEGAAGGEHGEAGAATPTDVRFFSVGDFTANLAGPASTHYVKVNINFEINKEADEEEMKQRKPQFRDKIISLLNSKKPSDLQSAEGRNYLKEEIKTVVNGFVQKGKVEGVYFSTFIIN